VVCPRCGRWNNRSLLAIVLKVLLVLVFIATVGLTVWAITTADHSPRMQEPISVTSNKSGSANGPDIGF
jgi:flagellar basal body-associated protein FliL